MKCNLIKLSVGLFLLLWITLMIVLAVMTSEYFLLLLFMWFFGLYKKATFIYRVEKNYVILFRNFRLHRLSSKDITKVFAERSAGGYRGFIFEYKLSQKLFKSGFSFGFRDYVSEVLNFINGNYPIDVKSFEKIGIFYNGKEFKYT